MPTDAITQPTLPQAPIKPFTSAPSSFSLTPPTQPAPTPVQPPVSQGTTPTGLDAGAVALAQAVRQTESGGNFSAKGASGEYGAYQWEPSTWAAQSKAAGVNVPLEDATPAQQNQVAYTQIKAWKDQGYNVGQIASMWNAGEGDPDAYLNGNKGTNSSGVSYDTQAYAQKVATAYQQFKTQQPTQNGQTPPTGANTAPQAPSVGGFLSNVVSSGANFAGNLVNAVAHPLQTGQNLLETGAGALDELGGQTNDNTAKFDQLKEYLGNRYGSISNLEHTIYSDPVGFAADLSTVLGTGAGVAGLGAKAAELGGLGEVGTAATETSAATEASGLAGGLKATAGALGTGAKYTNPLTPAVAGAGALLNKTKDFSDIIANPQNYSPEEMAKAAPEAIVGDVEKAFAEKQAGLSETGSGYDPIRQGTSESTGVSQGGTNQIPVAHDFLENQFRNVAKLDVVDGKILPTTVSTLEKSDLPKLQSILDTYKPAFQSGHISPEEFLALRTKLADAAYNDLGVKNTKIASIAEDLRNNLNAEYRSSIPGLSELDESYSTQRNNLNELKDGIIYKTGANKGELKTSFLNSAMKAVKNDDTDKLAQLEQILPGITKRLQIAKTIKDLGDPSFTTSLLEKGGLAQGFLTGDIKTIALAATAMILQKPAIAIPLMRALGANLALVKTVMANLAKTATGGASLKNVEQSTPQQEGVNPAKTPISNQNPPTETQSGNVNPVPLSSDLTALASSKNFDLAAARKAGYSDQDIQAFLAQQ